MKIINICHIIISWIIIILFILLFLIKDEIELNYYKIGPNNELKILEIPINNNFRYSIIIFYCIINTIITSINDNILSPFIINEIQDITKEQSIEISKYAIQIITIHTIYKWFDWIMYISILMSQIDFFIIELISDIITNIIITKYYIKLKNKEENINLLSDRTSSTDTIIS